MYLFQYNLLKSRCGSIIMFLHIWTVNLMYYVYVLLLLLLLLPVNSSRYKTVSLEVL